MNSSVYWHHESAIVDEGAIIGEGTKNLVFGPSSVCSGAVIGEGCSLGQNIFVGNRVVIGNNCKIQNNVSVYDNVTLKDDVFCGPRSSPTSTTHAPQFHARASIETMVRQGATLGANCTVVCGVTIGCYAFIGAGAVVNKDVPNYALMVGVPARQIGWMSEYGEQLDLPLRGNQETVCPGAFQSGLSTR